MLMISKLSSSPPRPAHSRIPTKCHVTRDHPIEKAHRHDPN
jgi:hypothetical protein